MDDTLEVEKSKERAEAALSQVAAGSEAGLRFLYERFGGLVYSLAFKILEDSQEAEEVVQDVFAKAWRLAGGYDSRRSAVKGWLCMIARSACLDRLRHRKRRLDRPINNSVALSHIMDLADPKAGIGTEGDEELAVSLESLRPEYRCSIELAFFKGYSHREIAAAMDIPEGTAKTFLRRGLLKLREVFKSK